MSTRFEDREDAGRQLAAVLTQFRERPDAIVLGLARGGIPIAAAVARDLYLPFGTVLVRKLGIPGHDETAYGALAWWDRHVVKLLNRPLVDRVLEHGVRPEWLEQVEERERAELARRAARYPRIINDVRGKTVLLVDDGLATGATMRAAVEAARTAGAAAVVVAAPVASIEAESSLARVSDAVLCLHLPGKFRAVGSFYRHFDQVDDDQAISLLSR